MQQKRNKSKAKREAKLAAKGGTSTNAVHVIMPNPTSVVDLTQVLKPAFRANVENAEALNTMAVALTRLRIHVGDGEDMALMFSRIMFGRRLAHFYFDDRIAENLHHAVQTIVLAVLDQYVDGQVVQVMSLDGEAGEEISESLHIIEDMAAKLDPAVYLKELLTHDAEVNLIDAEAHLQSWEDYLASVGTRASH